MVDNKSSNDMELPTGALGRWLDAQSPLPFHSIVALPQDAGLRRYYRVNCLQGSSYIAVDASLEKEKIPAFMRIAQSLHAHGILVPEVIKSDLDTGFLLLSDLGDTTLLKALQADQAQGRCAEVLYPTALATLAQLQRCQGPADFLLPHFTAGAMLDDLTLFKTWFIDKYLSVAPDADADQSWGDFFSVLVNALTTQPYGFMHRDYHAANLMLQRDGALGVLDFQDAFYGPITYDLVSLLRDCYIAWPPDRVVALALQYKNRLAWRVSDTQFLCWFDWMGLQRHMKALATFARKYLRDGNANYLVHIPRVLAYLLGVSQRYRETRYLHQALIQSLLPAYQKVSARCER